MVLVVKMPPANTGNASDVGSILGLGGSPGAGHDHSLQYFSLENPKVTGA